MSDEYPCRPAAPGCYWTVTRSYTQEGSGPVMHNDTPEVRSWSPENWADPTGPGRWWSLGPDGSTPERFIAIIDPNPLLPPAWPPTAEATP